MYDKINAYIKRLCWIPFAISFVGYYCFDGGSEGNMLSFWEAIYASITLYFVSPVYDNTNFLIMLGKMSSVLVTTSVVLSVLSYFWGSVSKWFICMHKDSVAVYTDNELGKRICETCAHGYISSYDGIANQNGDKAKNYFLIYSEDENSFEVLNKIRSKSQKHEIYVLLNEIDTNLLRKPNANIHYFNINDIIARDYWKKNHLYDVINSGKTKQTYKIGILGYGNVGKAIFKYGYMNNIYDPEQEIEYHVWGIDALEKDFLSNLIFGNADKVIIHDKPYNEDIVNVIEMDRVIITDKNSIKVVQELLFMDTTLCIHAYCENGERLSEIFDNANIETFGDALVILNEKNIKNERTYLQAKLFNYDYYLSYKELSIPKNYLDESEKQWKELSGFKRGSTIARADYYWIEKRKKEEGSSDEIILEMEHLRWCRFHYINNWKCGEKKDEKMRTHPLLVDFAQLPHKEIEKDGIRSDFLRAEIEALY